MKSSVIQRGKKTGDLDVDCGWTARSRQAWFSGREKKRREVETCPMGQFETVWENYKHSGDKDLEITENRRDQQKSGDFGV